LASKRVITILKLSKNVILVLDPLLKVTFVSTAYWSM